MVNIEEYHQICELIAKQLSYGMTPNEEQELRKWMEESEGNGELYHKITKPDYLSAQEKKRNSINVRSYWKEVDKEIGRRENNYFLRSYGKYAAVVLLLLGIGVAGWLLKPEPAEVLVQTENIQPGTPKALLVLANGKTVELGKEVAQQLDCDGTIINNDTTGLKYDTGLTGGLASVRHTLVIPKGGEYVMTLEDGTVVHLNSESKIEYPVRFTEKNREVYLEGEAYFKVVRREKQPFIVKTTHMDIKVSGTEFNVKAYSDEKWVQTTLVQGKVTVFSGPNRTVQHRLEAEQQAELDLEKGKLDIKRVNVAPFIAWKEGQFVFEGNHLEEIMSVLGKWYDFNVIYREEWIKNIEFAGKLNRSGSIEPILDVIRSTHKLHVDIQGKTIVFNAK